MKATRIRTAIALTVIGSALAGCGVRGALEAPKEAREEGATRSAEAGDAGSNSAAQPKPHKPFVLDGLLR